MFLHFSLPCFILQQKCRPLSCPFGHAPYYERCKQLLEITHGLSLEVLFSLSALWSKVDYNTAENTYIFRNYGRVIFHELSKMYVSDESGINCPFCNQSLRFVKEIIRSQTTYNYSAGRSAETTHLTKSTEPNLLFHTISITKKKCQLPNLLANAVKLSGSVIEIKMNGELFMVLRVDLVKENIQSLISGSSIIVFDNTYLNCFVTFQMTTVKTCPKIRISFSEFEPHMTENNSGIINNLFATPTRSLEDFIEICVNDYFDRLSKITFPVNRNTGSFGIRTELLILMCIIGIARQLL